MTSSFFNLFSLLLSSSFFLTSLSNPVPNPPSTNLTPELDLSLGSDSHKLKPQAQKWTLPAHFSSVNAFASDIKVTDWKWGKGNCRARVASTRKQKENEEKEKQGKHKGSDKDGKGKGKKPEHGADGKDRKRPCDSKSTANGNDRKKQGHSEIISKPPHETTTPEAEHAEENETMSNEFIEIEEEVKWDMFSEWAPSDQVQWEWEESLDETEPLAINSTLPSNTLREGDDGEKLPPPPPSPMLRRKNDAKDNGKKEWSYDAAPSGSDSILSVSIPAGSYGSSGGGGAGFYATPLDLSKATQAQLTYWIYFPSNFQWNKGGKLPGFYGGAQGCSGGNPATNCFSTRMMWRNRGVGELYLYAQRDKQSSSVCKNLALEGRCKTKTGISMGRGTFNFKRGAWNEVHQLVRLNTPKKQDGGFAVWINGKLVMKASTGVSFRNSVRTGFIGIMADFFYGGSSKDWAPTKDQTIHFSQVSISIDH